MNKKTTRKRNGVIDNTEVFFEVSADFNGPHVCGAEGIFLYPEDAHEQLLGTTKKLIDNATQISFMIFVSDTRFSFLQGYDNVDKLFGS